MSKIWTLCIVLVIFGSLFGQEGAEYLIITHDDFAQTINSLAEWKYMKGLQTKVVKLSEIGEDPSNEDIRNFIITTYNTWDPQPEYVLLVGDIEFLPVGQTFPPCRSDNYYANMEGDFKAELSVGRFPCQSAHECSTMLNKTTAYERTPWLEDTLWFKKSTIVIRFDDAGDTVGYYVDDLRYIRDTCMIPAGFSVDSLFWRAGSSWHYQGPDSAHDVIDVLNDGRGFLVYRGESAHDWYAPFNGIPESLSLVNGSKLPIVFAGACISVLTNISVGEKWLRAGTPDTLRGAVAYIGNSVVGSSFERHHLNRAFFKAICIEDSFILGHAFLRAKDSLYDTLPNEKFYAECNLLGDPTLQLWTEVPKSMSVQHPGVIEMDVPIDLVITVHDTESQLPIQGALVTLYKPNGSGPEIYESTITDNEGMVVFENLTVPTSGTMYATVTFQNCVPYQGEIQVYEMMTDDPLALAYNGNKHLVREPNTDNLHLVYTNAGNVTYRYSGDGGENWTMAQDIEEGEFPAICLDYQMNPCVTWTTGNRLFFGRKDPVQGWTSTSYSFGVLQPSHPCITVTTNEEIAIDTVHILVRFFDNDFLNNFIREVSFPVTNPERYQTRTLDASSGMNMITLDFPSIARDFTNTLHATWMHGDTVWYATRAQAQRNWNVWAWQFQQWGRQSDHPFVETYGDSIFMVWQNQANEEVYRGTRHLQDSIFQWQNLSQTPTISIYPVNASGLVTTFVDKSSALSEYDIFWKTYPGQPLHNLSNTPLIKSIFPHTSLQITEEEVPIQYTVWQEGNESPYEIKIEKTSIGGRESPSVSAYLNSFAGFETPSLYLIERDTFISNWQIPVDIGSEHLKYVFPLEPPYTYKVKIIAYHEFQGRLTTRVKLDGGMNILIRYNAFQPETLEILIPPALYTDSMIEAEFDNVSGGLALGPIYIYRYEQEGGGRFSGGAQSTGTAPLSALNFNFCNIFKGDVKINFELPFDQKTKVYLYDITGRLVRKMEVSKRVSITENNLSSGVYFLKIDNPVTGKSICWKFVQIK